MSISLDEVKYTTDNDAVLMYDCASELVGIHHGGDSVYIDIDDLAEAVDHIRKVVAA